MKKIQSINVGKGKVVLYRKDNTTTHVLMFEYKEDKNNVLFVSGYGEVLKDMLNNISITDQRDDAVQFCINLDTDVWAYFEYDYNERSLKEDTIDYNKLTLKEKKDSISGYYSSLGEVRKIYGKDAKQIIAECFFEQS
jgi:hypothetical protein